MSEVIECPFCGAKSKASRLESENFYQISATAGTLTSASGFSSEPVLIARLEFSNNPVWAQTLRCANAKCEKESLWVEYTDSSGEEIMIRLVPKSSAKPQPDYIPETILCDYREACAVLEDSPKASAVLARRCLQGMIRDFHKVKRKSLWGEIDELKNNAEKYGIGKELLSAFDTVRQVGNDGAHQNKKSEQPDALQMYDVSKKDAEMLIELLEILFKKWYVARHKEQQLLKGLNEIGERRKKGKTDGTAS